jgi:hypothetical protein
MNFEQFPPPDLRNSILTWKPVLENSSEILHTKSLLLVGMKIMHMFFF